MIAARKQNRRPGGTEPAAEGVHNQLVGPETYSDGAVHASLPSTLTAEIGRLYGAGFSLLPLGGDDGKKPIVAFKDRGRLPLARVLDRLAAAGSRTFGIRLSGMLVIDVDTDTPEARAYVETRFGSSPALTKTSRGFHLYFRHEGPKPPTIDLPGIRIDFKAGGNDFVVGALSQRPDGTIYRPLGRLVSVAELPNFQDRGADDAPVQRNADGRFPVGSRQKSLKRRAHQLALVADTFDEVLADLLGFRDWEVEQPEDFPDDKVASIAAWYWDLREKRELWSGRRSAVKIQRSAIDLIATARKGKATLRAINIVKGTASLLYNLVLADHGHKPGATFALVPDALRKSGRMSNGRRQIYDAIDLLIDLELLICVSQPRGNRDHYIYRLGPGRQVRGRIEEGEGSNLTLISVTDTHSGGLAA
ncbi:bifunctional DNA primase/polymerase [Mesorhizobium sp. WSM3873]|uniref:bifunctional DNA primase/polymerase n=1 Tax=Mesorhizobium sp. WSM3873 TaxID=1854056 RepID=UPI000800D73A|nr:bifunctional DNA primase/polymerase [Mesorhizobium sp. WSM3873]OBQ83184.1 hypothetical protein A9K71_25275 [Mesorhizobium sp. WSM3873]